MVVEIPNSNKRYNAPHLDSMEKLHRRGALLHIAIQEMSAVRRPTVKKTSTFSIKDLRKHF